jgi:hypothetical protein
VRKHEALRRDAGARLAGWLEAVDGVCSSDWEEPADLPDHVRAESEHWCDEVFHPRANPHDREGARRAVHRGELHLIRHAFTAGGLDLTVFEGRNFLLVRVDRRSLDLLSFPADARPAAVARVAEAIFRTSPRFRFCQSIGEGAHFCSAARTDPLALAVWCARADGGVRNGELWFAVYKKPSQLLGFAHGGQWFDDTGEAVRARARRAAPQSR